MCLAVQESNVELDLRGAWRQWISRLWTVDNRLSLRQVSGILRASLRVFSRRQSISIEI